MKKKIAEFKKSLIILFKPRKVFMGNELLTVPFGLYKIYWAKDTGGGTSLASVGGMHDGTRWVAPVNWTSSVGQCPAGKINNYIESIEMMVLIRRK